MTGISGNCQTAKIVVEVVDCKHGVCKTLEIGLQGFTGVSETLEMDLREFTRHS